MIRTCEECPTKISADEPAWKTLCPRCYARRKAKSPVHSHKKYEPAPSPSLFSPLRAAVEEKAPHRPAPFGSIQELMNFLFSSENRAACAEQSVVRLEKEIALLKQEISELKKATENDFF